MKSTPDTNLYAIEWMDDEIGLSILFSSSHIICDAAFFGRRQIYKLIFVVSSKRLNNRKYPLLLHYSGGEGVCH